MRAESGERVNGLLVTGLFFILGFWDWEIERF